MNHRALLSLVLCCAFGMAPAAQAQPAPFEVDAVLSLNGSGAFLGREQSIALDLAAQTINAQGGIGGRKLHFRIRDDQSSPQVAVQLANEVVQGGSQVFLGTSLAAGCNAVEPLIAKGPVDYCLSAGVRPPTGGYMFAYGSSTADIMLVISRYLRARGIERIAAIFPTDASGQDGERALDMALGRPENRALVLVDREHYNTSDVSAGAQLARIQAANPQFVVAWGTGTSLGTLLRSANDVGMKVPFAASAANLNYDVMHQFASYLPRELLMVTVPGVVPTAVGPGPLRAAAQTFFDAMQHAGKKPDANLITAWDPAMLIATALRSLGPDAGAPQLRRYLANLHGWYGAAGQYDFRDGSQRGLSSATMLVVRYDPKRDVFVPVSRIGGRALLPN